MTRDEIEQALLTTGSVNFGAGNGQNIVLSDPTGKRLAKIVFEQLRLSSASDLTNDQHFFELLETTFSERTDETDTDAEANEKSGEPTTEPDRRGWKLKKIKTRGFGGLNATQKDVFEFDAANQDFCIEGQNGSGKSSLANAVLFAMTGKIHRDQYGLLDDPTKSEPVTSDQENNIGNWPPIATYPNSSDFNRALVDISVKLTFGNEEDSETIMATRRLHGMPEALQQEAFVDPKLQTIPTLIEAGLLMPMRIQHIRVPATEDNSQLVGLIRQLIGLEPLLNVAELVDSLTNGSQRFRRYARDNKIDDKANQILRLLGEAREKIREVGTELNLSLEIEAKKPILDDQLQRLGAAKTDLDRQQEEGFKVLEDLSFEDFDPAQAGHRQRVAEAINQLHLDARRQSEVKKQPPVLGAIVTLSGRVNSEEFLALKLALTKALTDFNAANKWATRQREDTLLRLKAVAAAHFEDCDDPLCPLCNQSIKGPTHRDLIKDLLSLKSDAEAAQAQLSDACRRIEQEVMSAAQNVIPDEFMRIERFAVKQNIKDHVISVYVQPAHVADNLPGFTSVGLNALDAAFHSIEEVELGTKQPEPADGDDVARVSRLLEHLEDVVKGAENWKHYRQTFREAWARLFSTNNEHSITARIMKLKEEIEIVEPFRLAGENVQNALELVTEYNVIAYRQETREKVAEALRPLRELRNLVNLTTRRTIKDVSNVAKEIHGSIYNPETLEYEKAEISEYRRKQTLSFQARVYDGLDWCIDATLLANTSWMRGILWSFVFAIRSRAIEKAGCCPFNLIVLDDPQITFDTRNLRGWVKFLGRSDGLKQNQACQLLVMTHSMSFALEMTQMSQIRNAEIETGQPWANPSQIVQGDFASIRFERMISENSDERARHLIGDIRVLAETLLKHSIERFQSEFARRDDSTLGLLIQMIVQSNAKGETPYTDKVFCDVIAVKSSFPAEFKLLSEPHHSVSETISVREARQVYKFWCKSLFPAVRKVWEVYRFLQQSIIGEVAAISLPANCNHRPIRSMALAVARPLILGRVSAYSDGRAASAIRIDSLASVYTLDLNSLGAYRLEKDTLSPVARIGDILLTRIDDRCRVANLIVEDRGTYRVVRRWHEDENARALAVLAASSSNPREVPSAVISRAKGANRRKIVGVLFAADQLQPGEVIDPNAEATALEANSRMVAALISDTDAFEIQGGSAEPIALENQYLLAKPAKTDLAMGVRDLDGKPVIAEDNEDCAFFKRLRVLDDHSVLLESLDKTGAEGLIRLSTIPEASDPTLTKIREVVGVIFDKL